MTSSAIIGDTMPGLDLFHRRPKRDGAGLGIAGAAADAAREPPPEMRDPAAPPREGEGEALPAAFNKRGYYPDWMDRMPGYMVEAWRGKAPPDREMDDMFGGSRYELQEYGNDEAEARAHAEQWRQTLIKIYQDEAAGHDSGWKRYKDTVFGRAAWRAQAEGKVARQTPPSGRR